MEEETALNPVGNVIETIRAHIYDIRGKKVMLDRDLAELYHVETKRLNEAVKRNIERFPPDFMFQLSKNEFQSWRSQIVTSHDWMSQIATSNILMSQNATSSWGGVRKLPFAFTELGVSMLSSVLNSKEAIQMNINIAPSSQSAVPPTGAGIGRRSIVASLRDAFYRGWSPYPRLHSTSFRLSGVTEIAFLRNAR